MDRTISIDDWIHRVLARSPLATALGIGVVSVDKDRVVLAMPFRAENTTVARIVHGGAIASLVDVAGAAASASGMDEASATGGATASLVVSYLAPADGADLTAEAVVIQRSRSQTVCDVFVRDGKGVLVAKGMVTSRIFAKR